MSALRHRAAIAALACVVLLCSCERKPEQGTAAGNTTPAAAELKADKTFGPAMTAIAEASADVERIAALTLLQAALGQMNPSDVDARFDAAVDSYVGGAQSGTAIADALASGADSYVALAVRKAQESTTWPDDHDRNTWIGIGAIELQLARNELAAARDAGISPVMALHRINFVCALTEGQRGLSPASDAFARYDDLVKRGVARLARLRQPQRPTP